MTQSEDSAAWTCITEEKNILQLQQFVESVGELSGSTRIPSSVMTFVVIDWILHVFKQDKGIVNVTLENDDQWPLYLLMNPIITPIQAVFQTHINITQ